MTGSAINRREEKRREKRLAVALLIVSIGSALACLWRYGTGAVPGDPRSDYEWFFYPQKVFLSHWLSQGIFPWWNPHLFCGYPTAESQQHSLFYPFSTITFALLRPNTALFAFLSVHVILTGVLTAFSFGRCFRLRPLPAAAGSCVYMWGAVYMHRFYAGHFTITLALTWLPLAVGSIVCAVRGAKSPFALKRNWLVLAIVCMMCVIVAGAPQYIFYVFWAQVAVVAVAARAGWRPKAAALGLVWLIAIAGTMIYWLPSLIFIPYAARGWGQYPTLDGRMTRLCVLLEYLLPYPVGNGREYTHFQRRGVWDTSGYCGNGAVLLSLTCMIARQLLTRRLRETSTYAAALIILSVVMLSGFKFPGFDFFRETIRATILLILGSALAAAVALDALMRPDSIKTVKLKRMATIILSAAVIVLAVASVTIALQPDRAVTIIKRISDVAGGGHPAAVAAFEELSRNPWLGAWPMLQSLLFALGTCALLLAALAVKQRTMRGVVIGLVLLLDPLVQHYGLITPRVLPGKSGWPESIEPELREFGRRNLSRETGPVRVAVPTPMTHAAQLIPGLHEPFGFDALMPHMPYTRHTSRQSTATFEHRKMEKNANYAIGYEIEELWNGTGTPPESIPQRERKFVLKEVSSTATMVEIAPRVTIFTPGKSFIMTDEISNFVEPKFAANLPPDLTTTHSAHQLRSSWKWRPQNTPNEMTLDVQVNAPALLIVKSSWLPGWRVLGLADKKTRPVRVNGWMIGVPISPQDRTVILRYRPPYLVPCAVVSLLILCGLLIFTLVPVNRARRIDERRV